MRKCDIKKHNRHYFWNKQFKSNKKTVDFHSANMIIIQMIAYSRDLDHCES